MVSTQSTPPPAGRRSIGRSIGRLVRRASRYLNFGAEQGLDPEVTPRACDTRTCHGHDTDGTDGNGWHGHGNGWHGGLAHSIEVDRDESFRPPRESRAEPHARVASVDRSSSAAQRSAAQRSAAQRSTAQRERSLQATLGRRARVERRSDLRFALAVRKRHTLPHDSSRPPPLTVTVSALISAARLAAGLQLLHYMT